MVRSWLTFFVPVLLDVVVLMCMIRWVEVAVNQFQSRKEPCREKYEYNYGSYGYDYACTNRTSCSDDSECDLWDSVTHYGTTTYSCYSDCTSSCRCYPAEKYYALQICYMVFFSLAMVLDVVKAAILFCNVVNGQCCCCEDGGCCSTKSADPNCCVCCDHHTDPTEKSCLRHLTDSWVILAIFVFHPVRLRELREAHEKGVLPVSSAIKGIQWFARDIVLGVIMGLFIPVADYFNGWLVVYVIAVVLRWFSFRQRAMWNLERSTQVVTKESEGIEATPAYMQQQYPTQPVVSEGNKDQQYVTVFYHGPTPPKVLFQQQPVPLVAQQYQPNVNVQRQEAFSVEGGVTTQ